MSHQMHSFRDVDEFRHVLYLKLIRFSSCTDTLQLKIKVVETILDSIFLS